MRQERRLALFCTILQPETTNDASDNVTIAKTLDIATEYYDAFNPKRQRQDDIHEEHDFIAEDHDIWMYDLGITSEMVADCAEACPKGKTTGRDMPTMENWQMLLWTHPEAASHTAWNLNQRLMSMQLGGRQRVQRQGQAEAGQSRARREPHVEERHDPERPRTSSTNDTSDVNPRTRSTAHAPRPTGETPRLT